MMVEVDKPNSVADDHLSGPSLTFGIKRHFPRFLSGHGLACG